MVLTESLELSHGELRSMMEDKSNTKKNQKNKWEGNGS